VQALANGLVFVRVALNPVGSSGGTTLYALNALNGSVRWQMTTPGAGTVSAVIKHVAYITAVAPNDDPAQHNELQARDASDGSLLWRIQIAGTGDLAATIADQTIYLASFDSQRYYYNEHRWTAFYALNVADGTIRWHRTLGLSAGILAVANGQIYAQVGLTDVVCSSNVASLDASAGAEQWQFPKDTQDERDCTSFIGAENNVVCGMTTHENPPTVQTSLYALSAADGSKRWQITLPTNARDAALANGTIYFSSDDGLAAYRVEDGSRLWSVRGEGGRVFPFNGGLYASLAGRSVDALDPASGVLRWRYQTDDTVRLATVANGILLGVGSYKVTDAVWHQEIVALSASSGRLLWRFQIGRSDDSPLVG
jgi:outer membrane protein assembly factor BamB